MTTSKDLAAFQAMTEQFEAYLLSTTAFWPLGGRSDLPPLSLGAYLMVRQRLSAAPTHPPEVAGLTAQGEAVLTQWRATAERKALAELQHRLRLWEHFVETDHGRYATEVNHRAAMELLLGHFPQLADAPEAARLAAADQVLRQKTSAGPFVWDASLQTAFPQAAFWFLYRKTR